MAGTLNIHWAQDSELLERYARKQITGEERKGLDEHLRSCQDCQSLVQQEQEFLAGIREYGRDQLKGRLKLRLEHEPVSRVQWTRVISAAAVMVILLGLGIYNRWLFVDEKLHEEDRVRQAETQPQPLTRGETQAEAPAKKQDDVMMDRKGAGQTTSGLKGKKEPGSTTERVLKLTLPQDKEIKEMPMLTTQSGAGAASKQAAKDVLAGEMKDSKSIEVSNEMWVEGFVLPDAQRDEPREAAGVQAEQQTRMLKKSESRADIQKSLLSEEKILLEQRPSLALPTARQTKQKISNRSSVQTLIQRTDDGLRMILYLDSLVEDADLGSASVQRVSPDSVVVHFSNQSIGYQIPSQWNLEQTKKILRK